MKARNKLIKVYTGTELTVNLLKGELEESGISSIIYNDFKSGISAGFAIGTTSAVELFIQEDDLEKAESILSEFIKINND
jgi:hypothetical protein